MHLLWQNWIGLIIGSTIGLFYAYVAYRSIADGTAEPDATAVTLMLAIASIFGTLLCLAR